VAKQLSDQKVRSAKMVWTYSNSRGRFVVVQLCSVFLYVTRWYHI